MNLYHKKCKSNIYIKLDTVKILGAFTITTDGIKPVAMVLKKIESDTKKIPATFYCPTCDTEVVHKDIATYCSFCGKELDVTEAYKPTDSGGLYCAEHIKEFTKDCSVKMLYSILTSYTI